MAYIAARDRNLAFTDTETTGLDPVEHEIISIGVVVRSPSGEQLHRKEWFMHPRWPDKADSKALEINGYTHAAWEAHGVVSHETAMREYCEMTAGAIFVAHNITFDWGMLEKEWDRHEGVEWTGDYHKIDTVTLAWVPYFDSTNGMKSVSLRNVCAYYGVSNDGAHDALTDVDRMVEVYDYLMEDTWSGLFGRLFAKARSSLRGLWQRLVR